MEEENTSDTIADEQQNLNDLQSYLVNFNKEIGVNGIGSAFQHNLSQIITRSSQPVFVTVQEPTPDNEEIPVIKEQKDSDTEGSLGNDISVGEHTLDDQNSSTDMLYQVSQSSSSDDLDTHIVTVDNQIEDLISGKIHLQEFSLEELAAHCQQGTALSEGMVMLPLGDSNSILCQVSGPRLVQIVTINGQPTLQLISTASVIPHQSMVTDSQSIISGTNPVSVLASFTAANTDAIDQTQDNGNTQLVALQVTEDSSQPQLVSVPVDGKPDNNDDNNTKNASPLMFTVDNTTKNASPLMCAPLPVMKKTGYQSVAILPSGDASQQEINYVLIVNPLGDKNSVTDTVCEFGDNISGEVVEEITDETGIKKRLVRIKKYVKNLTTGEVMTVGEQLMCSVCSYSSPQMHLLTRHMKSHCHERPHKCSVCHHSFKTSSSLQNHINTHIGVRPHKCKVCDSAFTTSGELVRHVRYKHTFEKPHKCTECGYASVEMSKLKRHMRSHTGERPYACTYCNYASPDTYKLKRHMRIHTGEKPYQCEICSAKFTQSNSLKAHKLIHSGNKPVFQCTLCPATCGRKTDLKIHMVKLHSSDQPVVCKKCNQTFLDRYTFKVHMKTHEGEKCFKCTECEYSTASQRHLDMHILTHSGLKPFECANCDLAFRQKQLLKRHQLLYHDTDHVVFNPNDTTVECKECEKVFMKKENIEENLQTDESAEDGMDNGIDSTDSEARVGQHTCGGCPKALIENLTPLTADELIENSLLADMKEGKLGVAPKVMVVHPDGRVEEVTAKLQSLSQSKHMDDFLVSLGVSGDSQFDQVAGLPVSVSVAEVNSLVSVTESGLTGSAVIVSESGGGDMDDDGNQQTGGLVPEDIDIDHESAKASSAYTDFSYIEIDRIGQNQQLWKTKEEGTQANFDTDNDKKVKVLMQEEFNKLVLEYTGEENLDLNNITVIDGDGEHVYVSVLEDKDNRSGDKRAAEESDENPVVKKIKVVL